MEWASGDRAEIIGVVRDVRQLGLEHDPAAELYLAWATAPASQTVAMRLAGDVPEGFATSVTDAVRAVAPGATVGASRSGEQLLRSSLHGRTAATASVTIISTLALLLTACGVLATATWAAIQRRHELAIRLAMGAQGRDAIGMLMRSGLRPVLGGAAAGLLLSAVFSSVLQDQLFGVSRFDPTSYLLALLLPVGLAAAAHFKTARSAARVELVDLLRGD